MRCEVCGLVVADAQGAPSEARNAKETALNLLCGCQGVLNAAKALLKPDGTRLLTDDQARAVARHDLHLRGAAEYDAKIVLGLQRVAAGKYADTGLPKGVGDLVKDGSGATILVLTQAHIDAGKASAQEMLDAINNRKALEAVK